MFLDYLNKADKVALSICVKIIEKTAELIRKTKEVIVFNSDGPIILDLLVHLTETAVFQEFLKEANKLPEAAKHSFLQARCTRLLQDAISNVSDHYNKVITLALHKTTVSRNLPGIKSEEYINDPYFQEASSILQQHYKKIKDFTQDDFQGDKLKGLISIVSIFTEYLSMPHRLLNSLKIEFSKSISSTQRTLLSSLTVFCCTRDIFLQRPEYAKQITKKTLLQDISIPGEKIDPLIDLLGDYSETGEKDDFTVTFFTLNPHFLGWVDRETFHTPVQRYMTKTPLRDGTMSTSYCSIGDMLILHDKDEILTLYPAFFAFYDLDFFSSRADMLYECLIRDFFIKHPHQIDKIKHAALQQNVPGEKITLESIFAYTWPKYKSFRRLFCLYPALLNEFSPHYAKQIKKLHHKFFKQNNIEFPERNAKGKEANHRTAPVTEILLSAGETQLKNRMMLKKYDYAMDATELRDKRFTLSQINGQYIIHIKLEDDQTINMVTNARNDNKTLGTYAEIRENRVKDDYWLEIMGSDVENLLKFINAVFDNNNELRENLKALGFKEANLNDKPIEGFHLKAVNNNTAYELSFFYPSDVINKITAAYESENYGIHRVVREGLGKGGREKLILRAKQTNWLNFLKNRGPSFKIETAVREPKRQAGKINISVPKIELNQAAWFDQITRAFYQIDKLNIAIDNGRVEITLPTLNGFYELQHQANGQEFFFVPDNYLNSFVANLRTTLPEKTNIDIAKYKQYITITFRTKAAVPLHNDAVFKVHFENLQKRNQDLPKLLAESIQVEAWSKFLSASFAHVKDLKISFHWGETIYFQVDYPHHNPVWNIKNPKGAYTEVYVAAKTLHNKVLSYLQSNLADFSTRIVMHEGSVKIYTHTALTAINTNPHATIFAALDKAHKKREDYILNHYQISQQKDAIKMIPLESTQRSKEKTNKQRGYASHQEIEVITDITTVQPKPTVAKESPSVTLAAIKQCLIQTIPMMNATQIAALRVQGDKVSYALDTPTAFGCLSVQQVLQIAINVINDKICTMLLRQMKTLPLQLLLLNTHADALVITTAVDLSEHLPYLEDEREALTTEFQRRYHVAVHAFMNARQDDCIVAPVVATVANKPAAIPLPSAHSLFIAFFQALLSINTMRKELLILHADKFLQFENYSVEDKNHQFYEHIARSNLIRFLALLNYLTQGQQPQIKLFRDFARHTLKGSTWAQFKMLTQSLVHMMQALVTDTPKTNELCVLVFQQLFEADAAKIAIALATFVNKSEKQRLKEKVQRRTDHAELKKVIEAMQASGLVHEDIRDGVVGILADIGESVTEGFITHSQDKVFLQLCKDIFVNFGHYEFNKPYADFIKEQYHLFLNYQLNLKIAAGQKTVTLFAPTNTPANSVAANATPKRPVLNPNASVFTPSGLGDLNRTRTLK